MNDSRRLQRLIQKAKDGDTDAYHGLFELLVERLYAYALSYAKDEARSEDIVQETFIELWNALPSFSYQGEPQFFSFVYTILKRKIMWHRSESAKHRSVSLGEEHEALFSHTPDYEDYRHLGGLVEMLSDMYQEVLKLRYWGALSFSEIAATLQINESAAKVRHHRALQKLQELLAHRESEFGRDL